MFKHQNLEKIEAYILGIVEFEWLVWCTSDYKTNETWCSTRQTDREKVNFRINKRLLNNPGLQSVHKSLR
jgi:hypothetical protein